MRFTKFLITIILTLIVLINIKSNKNFKSNFYKYVYDTNISFTYFNNLYNKYISNIDLLNANKANTVFSEKLEYKSKEKYKDGVLLNIDEYYLVPINESGIVVFIGEKEDYGNTVIIQRYDGIDEWYGNIYNVNVKLYDYVKQGDLLGEASNKIYLVYKKDGNVLNYEEYLK